MGYYTEYLNAGLAGEKLTNNEKLLHEERKKELKAISGLRGDRDILVIAGDIYHKPLSTRDSASIEPNDVMWVADQLEEFSGNELDVILETPGGLGTVVEDIGRMLRKKYERVGMIIPGIAKSAGTILTMCGDEILMGPYSALGPIDAQIRSPLGRSISVHAFLEGFSKIKKETIDEGRLNPAYIPMLQKITPGDLQEFDDAKKFVSTIVSNWLVAYKFKYWDRHSSTNNTVTVEEKKKRALEIAEELGNKSKWLTHDRSIMIEDLEEMGLKIENFSMNKELEEHILRYYTLLKVTLNETSIFKLFETPETQIYRFQRQEIRQTLSPSEADSAISPTCCKKCSHRYLIQFNFHPGLPPAQPGAIIATSSKKVACPKCGQILDIEEIICNIEKGSGRKILLEKEATNGK